MAFPLGAVLSAAPGIISAAADIIRVIRERNNNEPAGDDDQQSAKLEELTELVARQAKVIEELAVSNSKLALEVRNNRIFSVVLLIIAGLALIISLF